MTDLDTIRAIRAEIIKAECALAQADALATETLRTRIAPELLEKAETAHRRATKAVNTLHRALEKAVKTNGDITPQFGK
jgi:hypothetical protein